MRLSRFLSSALSGALLLSGASAFASDGVAEINQTCAVSTGCFAGDSPGFPVTVTETGSYALTSNLVIPSGFFTAVQFFANDVSLDLRGFAVTQTGCVGISTDCTPTGGSGYGIQTVGSTVTGAAIRNGSVTGMGLQGIASSRTLVVENVKLRWNRSGGILAGPDSQIRNCIANENGSDGIVVGSGSTVSGSTANGNASEGIRGGQAAMIFENFADDNGGNGILCLAHCNARDNTVRASGLAGIRTSEESRVSGNMVSDSGAEGIRTLGSTTVIGNSSNGNGGDGIQVGNASMVRNNTANSNQGSGDGIDAGSGSNVTGNSARSNVGFGLRSESTLVGFAENVFGNNNGGTGSPQTSSGSNLGGNLCDASTVCP